MTKEELRKEYEAETGQAHRNPLFSTTKYACWLEKKLIKRSPKHVPMQARKLLTNYNNYLYVEYFSACFDDTDVDEFLKSLA